MVSLVGVRPTWSEFDNKVSWWFVPRRISCTRPLSSSLAKQRTMVLYSSKVRSFGPPLERHCKLHPEFSSSWGSSSRGCHLQIHVRRSGWATFSKQRLGTCSDLDHFAHGGRSCSGLCDRSRGGRVGSRDSSYCSSGSRVCSFVCRSRGSGQASSSHPRIGRRSGSASCFESSCNSKVWENSRTVPTSENPSRVGSSRSSEAAPVGRSTASSHGSAREAQSDSLTSGNSGTCSPKWRKRF